MTTASCVTSTPPLLLLHSFFTLFIHSITYSKEKGDSPQFCIPRQPPPKLNINSKTKNDHKHGENCLLTNITLLIKYYTIKASSETSQQITNLISYKIQKKIFCCIFKRQSTDDSFNKRLTRPICIAFISARRYT